MTAAAPGPTLLRVCLLHNYRERQHQSMKRYGDELGTALGAHGVQVDRVRVPDVLPSSWQRVSALSKLDSYAGRFVAYPLALRHAKADVFHIVDHGQAHLLGHLDAARTVVTCHDVILLALAAGRLKGPKPPRVATAVLRYATGFLPRARRLIADSEHTKRDLVSLVGVDPERVTVVYPGLNPAFRYQPELREMGRRRWGLGDGSIVLHFGHTGFYKNIEGCLQVIARLRKGGLDVTFVRGGQPMRPQQYRLAERLGIAHVVRDLGAITENDLPALYHAADVFLFPSLYEGFGWPPLEAMACGVPVVCSREGSLGEVMSDVGLMTAASDEAGLTERVAAVLTQPALGQPLRPRLLNRARVFDWNRAASAVLETYLLTAGLMRPVTINMPRDGIGQRGPDCQTSMGGQPLLAKLSHNDS